MYAVSRSCCGTRSPCGRRYQERQVHETERRGESRPNPAAFGSRRNRTPPIGYGFRFWKPSLLRRRQERKGLASTARGFRNSGPAQVGGGVSLTAPLEFPVDIRAAEALLRKMEDYFPVGNNRWRKPMTPCCGLVSDPGEKWEIWGSSGGTKWNLGRPGLMLGKGGGAAGIRGGLACGHPWNGPRNSCCNVSSTGLLAKGLLPDLRVTAGAALSAWAR